MKAWLVSWVWAADAAALADEIATILPARWSRERVSGFVEFLYAQTMATPTELAAYAKNHSNNPYRAELQNFGRISCGANPFLYARPVSDLTIEQSEIDSRPYAGGSLPYSRSAPTAPPRKFATAPSRKGSVASPAHSRLNRSGTAPWAGSSGVGGPGNNLHALSECPCPRAA
jgi:hypothetical protein